MQNVLIPVALIALVAFFDFMSAWKDKQNRDAQKRLLWFCISAYVFAFVASVLLGLGMHFDLESKLASFLGSSLRI